MSSVPHFTYDDAAFVGPFVDIRQDLAQLYEELRATYSNGEIMMSLTEHRVGSMYTAQRDIPLGDGTRADLAVLFREHESGAVVFVFPELRDGKLVRPPEYHLFGHIDVDEAPRHAAEYLLLELLRMSTNGM